jgi:Skp family chaperone for outer membrane proteins
MNTTKKPIHRLLRLTVAALLLAAFAAPVQAQPKIAVIDLKKVFDGYWMTKQADTKLKERAAELDKTRKGMVEDYQKAGEEYKKLVEGTSDPALSTEEREKRKTSAEKKLLELKEIEQSVNLFDRTSRTTLSEQQRRMRDRILEDVREVINAKAKASGFTLVLDTAAESANQTPVVIYSNGENDLSDAVLSDLNAKAPVNLPAITDKSDEKKDEPKENKK